MQKNKVLDSSALVAYFEAENGCEKVVELFQKVSKERFEIFLSVANWAEVLSVIERRHGLEKSQEAEVLMERMDMEIVPLDKEVARQAVRLKTRSKLHYLDAFAVALAIDKKAELFTADKDFESVKGQVPIVWI